MLKNCYIFVYKNKKMNISKEQQELRDLIESYVVPLRKDIKELKKVLEERYRIMIKKEIKSICENCRFINDCRFKAENTKSNCHFFVDKDIKF